VNASVIVVGLKGSPADEWLIRYAAHLAGLSDARLQGVHVRAIDNLDQPPKARLERDRRLLGELGGTLRQVRADDPASGLIRAARKAGACLLVIGSRRRSCWSRLLTGSTVADQVLRAAGDLPVQVVIAGGTSGTGLATVKAAARCGAQVTVISRQPTSIDQLAQLPPGTRGRAADLCCEPGNTVAIVAGHRNACERPDHRPQSSSDQRILYC